MTRKSIWLCLVLPSCVYTHNFQVCSRGKCLVLSIQLHKLKEMCFSIDFVMTAVDCGTLTNPVNGQVSHPGGTTFGQTATYSCNTGYNLVGDSTRTCQATRVWSGSAPICQGSCVSSTPDVCLYLCACICVLVFVCLYLCACKCLLGYLWYFFISYFSPSLDLLQNVSIKCMHKIYAFHWTLQHLFSPGDAWGGGEVY